ncbi:protein SPMIP7-like [Glandiceps talaboti]
MVDAFLRPRPGFQTIMMTDANAGGNCMQQITHQQRLRHMKFPKLVSRGDFDSFQYHNSPGFVKYHDDTLAPNRDNIPILDPTSGFISAGGDVDRLTGVSKLPTMQQIDNPPNQVTPGDPIPKMSIEARNVKSSSFAATSRTPPEAVLAKPPYTAPPHHRSITDPGPWCGRKISDAYVRAQLGGWTSDRDPREVAKEEEIKQQKFEQLQKTHKRMVDDVLQDKGREWRDKLALRYMYTSSTQRAYDEVDWDSMLAPKVKPPQSTQESQADTVSHRFTLNKRYAAEAEPWQNLGRSWDWFQARNGNLLQKPMEFCSHSKKVDQIPNYTGCINGDDPQEKDDPRKFFLPTTILRTEKPRYTDTAHRPNIPRYAGCTHWSSRIPANSEMPTPPPQSTARVHSKIPIPANESPHKRLSHMSKMVTLVPPGNPFNRIASSEVTS